MVNDTLLTVAIDDISPNPYQPRLHFKMEELEELANSIKQNGLIQPIIVRQSDIFGYELVAGERRLRAAKLAGLKEIPVIMKSMTNTESMQQAIIENLQRSDLDPIEEALAYQQLIDKKGLTHEVIADYMGKSRPYITNSLRLLQLPQTLQKGLQKKEISPGHARLLLTLSEDEQLYWFAKIQKEHLSVRQVQQALHKSKQSSPAKVEKNIFQKDIEQRLSQQIGLPVRLKHKQDGSGQVVIPFSDTAELHRIINNF
ncbi:ParB/RepB/Spo0J family partition protein [Streptococcus sp. zg-JUN1979]|uniref:ParB/RepB/Spo0J family partition protein n=1 Tax=Streptococcus sp. zg-JUN1979 TaxID=3391450 RepID=UPI0039A418DA